MIYLLNLNLLLFGLNKRNNSSKSNIEFIINKRIMIFEFNNRNLEFQLNKNIKSGLDYITSNIIPFIHSIIVQV